MHQDVAVHNVLRFERPDGTTVAQSRSKSLRSTVATETGPSGGVTLVADLSNVYFYNQAFVQHWTRRFEFQGDTLRVTDTYPSRTVSGRSSRSTCPSSPCYSTTVR